MNTEKALAILTPLALYLTIKDIMQQNYWPAIYSGFLFIVGVISITKWIKQKRTNNMKKKNKYKDLMKNKKLTS